MVGDRGSVTGWRGKTGTSIYKNIASAGKEESSQGQREKTKAVEPGAEYLKKTAMEERKLGEM